MKALLTFLGSMLVLGGCTAMLTAPVTMPFWILLGIGCVFFYHPVIQIIWWLFTILSLLQSLLIALFGFLAWYDLWQHGTWTIQVQDTLFYLFLFPAIASIAITIAMILASFKLDSMPRRSLILLIHILAAAFTIGPVVYMLNHH